MELVYTKITIFVLVSVIYLQCADCVACNDITFDAVTKADDGHTYAFSGDRYYRLRWSVYQLSEIKSKPIQGNWLGLPSNVDAAILQTGTNGKSVLFFKGDMCYRFKDHHILPYYPRPCSTIFKNFPGSIDAAFEKDGVTYLNKGRNLHRYYQDGRLSVIARYFTKFRQLPPFQASSYLPVDRRHVYFWKNQIWALDHNNNVKKPFPLNIGAYVLRCK